MPKAIPLFTFIPNGLTVDFYSNAVGIVDSYHWSFGFINSGTPVYSTLENPPGIIFPSPGNYTVTLSVTNADGIASHSINIVLANTPIINLPILSLVRDSLPPGIALDPVIISQSIRNWQIFLQKLLVPPIPDADLFNELAWPPICNLLISKLCLYDLILKAASAAMLAYSTLSNNVTPTDTNTTLVMDYQTNFNEAVFASGTITVNLIIIDGVSYGPSPILNSLSGLLNWLNSLMQGIFTYDSGKIISLSNLHVIITFNYTHSLSGGTNSIFTSSNPRVVAINTVSHSSGGTSGGNKGALKRLETGPSSAEWYDGSQFWLAMFKGATGLSYMGPTSTQSGIVGSLITEICLYASNVGVRLPLCPIPKRSHLFLATTPKNNHRGYFHNCCT